MFCNVFRCFFLTSAIVFSQFYISEWHIILVFWYNFTYYFAEQNGPQKFIKDKKKTSCCGCNTRFWWSLWAGKTKQFLLCCRKSIPNIINYRYSCDYHTVFPHASAPFFLAASWCGYLTSYLILSFSHNTNSLFLSHTSFPTSASHLL